jgi:hypothetical protein
MTAGGEDVLLETSDTLPGADERAKWWDAQLERLGLGDVFRVRAAPYRLANAASGRARFAYGVYVSPRAGVTSAAMTAACTVLARHVTAGNL